ncbi:MAG TPA: hypothetical protein VFB28_10460 [Terriglobales bacterium]|nr:hypothetical protein [Terriglobales bacterium]
MAVSTLANPSNSHQPLRTRARTSSPAFHLPSTPKFRVLATGEADYHWRIVALATNHTVSHHKSLTYALRKCTRLNRQLEQVKPDPLTIALSGFRDVNSYRAYYEGVGNDF